METEDTRDNEKLSELI